MTDQEKQVGRALFETFLCLRDCMTYMVMPDGADKAVRFTAANLERLQADPTVYDGVRIKPDRLDTFGDVVVRLFVAVLTIGKLVNQYRKVMGKRPINWYEEAALLDQSEKIQ